MHGGELLRFYLLTGNSFHQTTLMEATQSRTEMQGTEQNTVTIPDGALLFVPFSLVVVWSIVVLIVLDVRKVAKDGLEAIKLCGKHPCRKCQYFVDNPYLKCAVRPEAALTQQAFECPDYYPL